MRNSSAYRQYNSHLPRWLHNRPRQFITHCCQRLTHAQSITKEDISQEGDGQFLVKSQSDNKISYHVHFGDCSNMPSCTCPDWQRHHWPCKHFVAIYKHFPEWGWEAMSPYYSSSPYFQIVNCKWCSFRNTSSVIWHTTRVSFGTYAFFNVYERLANVCSVRIGVYVC